MAQLVEVVKKFDDGTETVLKFAPQEKAAEIEAAVQASQEELVGAGKAFSEPEEVEVVAEEEVKIEEEVEESEADED